MGQKVNPIGIRLKINRSWLSSWYDEQKYRDFIIEDLKIQAHVEKKFLRNKNFRKLEISDVKVSRIGKNVNLKIYTSRPGLVIGKKGQDIEKLRKEVLTIVGDTKKINIDIVEIKKVDLDAKIVAQSIGKAIENRAHYKKAIKQAIFRSIKTGAKGVKVQIAGRLNGADMARRESFREGSIPLHTFDSLIEYGRYDALTTYGILGVTVWINTGKKSKEQVSSINL